MKKLSNVTLVTIDCLNYGNAISALQKSMDKCEFGSVKLLTDIKLTIPGIEVILIDKIKSKKDYSVFCIKELSKYIETDYVLIQQHDSWVLDEEQWDNTFLDYDYIGAKWMYPKGERNVGNGGFSLRSRKLCNILSSDVFILPTEQEDDCIVRLYGSYLEQTYNIKFAPEEIADAFAFELNEPVRKSFGFHSYFHKPYKPIIVIKRTAALGDVIMSEPIIAYYFERGCQVYLDTLPEFMSVFFQYRFPLRHISKMNPKIVPEKVINLDMAYESKPQQPVLKSYFEFAEITDRQYRNSQLDLRTDSSAYLFSKYILIHNDETGMPHRNCYGVNWEFVVNYYKRLGWDVFQIGRRTQEIIATHINTPTLEMLMLVIKGADLVIALDSSPAQIAVALGIPAAIFFGSVDHNMRYYNFDKIQPIHSPCPKKEDDFCYHSESGTTGVKCKYDAKLPPCTQYYEWQIINAANKLLPK